MIPKHRMIGLVAAASMAGLAASLMTMPSSPTSYPSYPDVTHPDAVPRAWRKRWRKREIWDGKANTGSLLDKARGAKGRL